MKLVTYSKDDSISCAILTDAGLIDIPRACPAPERYRAWDGSNPPRSVNQILRRGQDYLSTLAELEKTADNFIPLDSVQLLAPIPRPGKIIALAGNYSEHIKEASITRGFKLGLSDSPRNTTVPRPFIMPATAVNNPGCEIPWPSYSRTIDYELELGVVIGPPLRLASEDAGAGKPAKAIRPEDALDYVAGYTIVNDVSARSVTFVKNRGKRPWDEFYDWLNGKWADGFCPMGPYLLTADEIEDV
ncbi:MAG: fumarylacetoacetate hydrolase family protein, partial [Sedimentisphaerales bacterium]|nr:fumarylacetoacetate hydrolase family protein [Sedimentisphaerales bacterium]